MARVKRRRAEAPSGERRAAGAARGMTDALRTAAGRVVPLLGTARERATEVAAPVARRVGPAWATFTPAARALLVIGAIAWLAAAWGGWREMAVVAAGILTLLVLAALFMIGHTHLEVRLTTEPPRVTVGNPVTGEVEVRNKAKSPLLPVRLDLPVGQGGVAFDLPALRPGSTHAELFVVPTERRGVIEVGPVTTGRGDPVGLFRREVTWSDVHEIFVHPVITPLEPLGAGLIRDLEGNVSENVSQSDLAFHALREYLPGDDLRHIHWRSSARHGQLLVRQFLDTRRSHINVIVDSDPASYRDPEDYELAISAAASLLVRAIMDGFDATFLSGQHAMTRGTGRSALDACSRAELSGDRIMDVAGRGARLAPDTSLVCLVTGPHAPFTTLQRAAAHFPIEVGKIAMIIDPQATASLKAVADLPLLTLGALSELPGLLKWGL
ncbi:DUF58 domain-containing protein [Nocardioides jiangxiensis]|uniref:DUF58 domain-containing protein n=1 Tax=Nocardioides jiangxiensis TaxID=3064524 RepID=A0ABT9AZ15_9ACTN|nr:DUF58 domain-containing protein [Nocardioides sp. WY-20]MDO7867830.1 DUF58 domain-containing protein [Nocardioides sp. WY-20]